MAVKYLLDASWVVRYLRGQPEIVSRLEELRPEGLGISIITVAELNVGAVRARDTVKVQEGVENFLSLVSIFDVTRPICQLFAEWSVRLQQRGQGLEHFYVLIAATALHHGLVLCTTNRRHFERFEGFLLASLPKT